MSTYHDDFLQEGPRRCLAGFIACDSSLVLCSNIWRSSKGGHGGRAGGLRDSSKELAVGNDLHVVHPREHGSQLVLGAHEEYIRCL